MEGRIPWLQPDRFGPLLVIVLLTFVTTPLAADQRYGLFVLGLQSGAVVIVALIASGVARRYVLMSLLVVVAAAIAFAYEAASRDGTPAAWPSAMLAVLLGSTPFFVLRRVLRQPRVTIESVAGSLSAYLLLGLAFGALFQAISLWDPGAFNQPLGAGASYFSFVTLVTLGYGDIVPVSDIARSLASLEAVLGQVLLVTLVARSVSTLGQDRPERAPR